MNFYEELGIKEDADDSTIKTAYRKLAKENHPDVNPGNKTAEEKFKKITEAYETLSDKDKKAAYDYSLKHGGESPFGSFGGMNPEDIFGSMFNDGSFGFSKKKTQNKNGRNIRQTLRIPLEFTVTGKKLDIEISKRAKCDSCSGTGKSSNSIEKSCPTCNGLGTIRSGQGFFVLSQTCPKCKGEGKIISNPCNKCLGEKLINIKKKIRVDIPAGIDSGMGITIPGEGESGIDNGKDGDLYIMIDIIENKYFERNRHDLYCKIPITVYQAIDGDQIEITHINGNKIKAEIKPLTQNGSILRLKGMGVPVMNQHNKNGDLYIEIEVKIPEQLTDLEKEAFKTIKELHKNENKNPSFIER